MATRDRKSSRWMGALGALWMLFAAGLVVFVLFATGVLGGANGNDGAANGGEGAVAEANGNGNGETANGNGNGGAANGNGNGQGGANGGGDDEANGDGNGNGANGNGDSEADTEEDGGDGAGANGEAAFTQEQSERGQAVFSQNCAQCHGGQLDGNPPLSGPTFAATWDGQQVRALFEVISQTMPQDAPGSLEREEYEDVTAHVLAFNGMEAGDAELGANDETMQVALRLEGAEQAEDGGDGEGGEQAGADDGGGSEEDASEQAEGGEQGDGADQEGGAEQADGGQQGGDAEGEGADGAQDGQDEGAGGSGEQLELAEEPGPDAQPETDEGWLVIDVRPPGATVSVLGPQGYMGRFTGGGTLTGLEPGIYLVAASQGNFSDRFEAEVRLREVSRVNLVMEELAGSEDTDGGGQQGGGDDQAGGGQGGEGGQQGGEAGGAEQNGDGGQNGNGAQNGNGGQNGDDDQNGNGDQGGNGDGDQNGNGEQNGEGDQNGNDEQNGEDGEAWYSEEQAERGADVFSASCSSCHGSDGMGDPPLADGAIAQSFETVWDLFDYTSSEMPQDSPGSLSEDEYVDVTAHMLQLNDFPAGDDELEADEDAMSDMQLSEGGQNGNGEDAGGSEENANGSGDEASGNGEGAETGDSAEAEGDGGQQEAQEDTAAGRGSALYQSNCARCHGANLAGVTAPPLAGPVFMERWGGHPVHWLYFQARMSMPPEAPRSLADEAYVDLIVYVLTENGLLEGDEEFEPGDARLEAMIIGTAADQDLTLQRRIDELRQTLHRPFDQVTDPEAGTEETGVPAAQDQGEEEGTEDGEAEGDGENGEGENADGQDGEGDNADGQDGEGENADGQDGEGEENGGGEGDDAGDDGADDDSADAPEPEDGEASGETEGEDAE